MKSAARNLVVTRSVSVRSLLEGLPIHGQLEGARKQLFHRLGFKFWKELAIALRMPPTEYLIRIEEMSQDSSGEVWLHTKGLFLRMSQDFMDTAYSDVYRHNIHHDADCGAVSIRKCFGLSDYGRNQTEYWMPSAALENVETAADWILNFKIARMGDCDNG